MTPEQHLLAAAALAVLAIAMLTAALIRRLL